MSEKDGLTKQLLVRAAELLGVFVFCLIVAGCISILKGGNIFRVR